MDVDRSRILLEHLLSIELEPVTLPDTLKDIIRMTVELRKLVKTALDMVHIRQ